MKILKSLAVMTFVILTACGGKQKDTNEENLTPIQKEAVSYVRHHLERGDKLESYQIIEESLPVSIMEQPFQNLRNVVFKAGLDYQSCKTRGLEKGMEMAEEKIENARQQILETRKLLEENVGGVKSLILLGKIKTPRAHNGDLQSLIVVFNPETMESTEWIPVTTPVQNSVALVVCAEENTLSEYAKEQNHETAMLAAKVQDPVLKFVLESKAL